MKIKTKIKLFSLLSILMFGLIVNAVPISAASSKILVTDNDGDNEISIGDKFCLNSECFYVIKNADGSLQALAEYNLYVGANYRKVTLDINQIYILQEYTGTRWQDSKYIFKGEEMGDETAWTRKIIEEYNSDCKYSDWCYLNSAMDIYGDEYEVDGATYRHLTFKFYPYNNIGTDTEGYALQNELARGVTGEKGNANYPIYATTNMFYENAANHMYYTNLDNFADGYLNFDFTQTNNYASEYLGDYWDNLNDMGYDPSDIDLLNVKELNELVHTITNRDLPLAEWYNASVGNDMEYDELGEYGEIGSIKQFLSDDYAWIWNTTYWLKTLVGNEVITNAEENKQMVYFMSSAGDICYSDSCANSIPRAGMRPVITMETEDFELNRLDINGTVRWIDDSDASRIRPRKSVIKLYQNGNYLKQVEVEKDDDEDLWRFTFLNLAKYDNDGDEYVYTITQDDIPRYASNINNFDVVNRYTTNPNTGDETLFMFGGLLSVCVLLTVGILRRSRR